MSKGLNRATLAEQFADLLETMTDRDAESDKVIRATFYAGAVAAMTGVYHRGVADVRQELDAFVEEIKGTEH